MDNCSHNGEKLQNSILNKINTAMGGTKKIRKTDITLYNFRHHKASLLYYLPGVSVKAKAAYLGHSEEMFLKVYSHMMEEKEDKEVLRDAVNL
jgi:integrase